MTTKLVPDVAGDGAVATSETEKFFRASMTDYSSVDSVVSSTGGVTTPTALAVNSCSFAIIIL